MQIHSNPQLIATVTHVESWVDINAFADVIRETPPGMSRNARVGERFFASWNHAPTGDKGVCTTIFLTDGELERMQKQWERANKVVPQTVLEDRLVARGTYMGHPGTWYLSSSSPEHRAIAPYAAR